MLGECKQNLAEKLLKIDQKAGHFRSGNTPQLNFSTKQIAILLHSPQGIK